MGLRGTNSACWGWYLGQGCLILFIVTTNLKLPTQKPDLSQLCKRNSTLFAITQLENQWWRVNHLSPTFALETTYQNWWYDQIDPIAWNAGHTLVASCMTSAMTTLHNDSKASLSQPPDLEGIEKNDHVLWGGRSVKGIFSVRPACRTSRPMHQMTLPKVIIPPLWYWLTLDFIIIIRPW